MPLPSPAEFQALRDLVTEALDRPADQRDAFLLEHAVGDTPLLDEARRLVRAYEQTEGVLHPAADAWLGLGGVDLLSLGGQRVGRYRLERLISEGAMAAVYLATQANPQRSVALKLIRFNLPLIDAAGRFMREADALGRVQHPNVARIFEAGVHRAGPGGDAQSSLPFIAMEYVDGPPLTEYARERRLTREQRLRLMIKVAEAVHAAHQRAILHRDLKPANVLVDSTGEPKVLDFGIARVLGAEDADACHLQTTAGVLVGTPGYMSPEQAAGRVEDLDVRSDVWALGVLLYELLTGRLPIDTAGVSMAEVLRRIETAEPVPVSRWDRSLRGDLDVIVLTALAREKEQRYPSALALADDLRRVLDYEPIAARPPSALYRFRKFARRHRFGLGAGAAFAGLVGVSGVLLWSAYMRAGHERDKARAVNAFLQEVVAAPDPAGGRRDVSMLEALRAAEARIAPALGPQPEVEAEVRASLGWTYFGLSDYDAAHAQLARAIELRERLGTADSAEGLRDRSRLATTLRWQYRPADALRTAEAALSSSERGLGADHEVTLTLRDVIAGCHTDMEHLPAAEAAYRDLLDRCRRHLGPTDNQTLLTLNNLAGVLMAQGQYAEAEAVAREALEGFARRGGAGSLHALSVRGNLAVIAAEVGRLEDSIEQTRALAADQSRLLGDRHSATLATLQSLANLSERHGDTSAAAGAYEDLLNRHLAGGGWTVPALETAMGHGALLVRARRYAEAQAIVERAVAGSAGVIGPSDLLYHRLRMLLASAWAGQGQFSTAGPVYREGLAFLESRFGRDHRESLIAANNYGRFLIDSGDGPSAVAVLEGALARAMDAGFTPMEPVMRRNLGEALRVAGRYEAAEAELRAAWELSRARGEGQNATRAAEGLVRLYEATSRPTDAAAWRDRATSRPVSR